MINLPLLELSAPRRLRPDKDIVEFQEHDTETTHLLALKEFRIYNDNRSKARPNAISDAVGFV